MKLTDLPGDLKSCIFYGRYGEIMQYYIEGVDGTLAQLGHKLPSVDRLRKEVMDARKAHKALIRTMRKK